MSSFSLDSLIHYFLVFVRSMGKYVVSQKIFSLFSLQILLKNVLKWNSGDFKKNNEFPTLFSGIARFPLNRRSLMIVVMIMANELSCDLRKTDSLVHYSCWDFLKPFLFFIYASRWNTSINSTRRDLPIISKNPRKVWLTVTFLEDNSDYDKIYQVFVYLQETQWQ